MSELYTRSSERGDALHHIRPERDIDMTRLPVLGFANLALAATPVLALALAAYTNALPLF